MRALLFATSSAPHSSLTAAPLYRTNLYFLLIHIVATKPAPPDTNYVGWKQKELVYNTNDPSWGSSSSSSRLASQCGEKQGL